MVENCLFLTWHNVRGVEGGGRGINMNENISRFPPGCLLLCVSILGIKKQQICIKILNSYVVYLKLHVIYQF